MSLQIANTSRRLYFEAVFGLSVLAFGCNMKKTPAGQGQADSVFTSTMLHAHRQMSNFSCFGRLFRWKGTSEYYFPYLPHWPPANPGDISPYKAFVSFENQQKTVLTVLTFKETWSQIYKRNHHIQTLPHHAILYNTALQSCSTTESWSVLFSSACSKVFNVFQISLERNEWIEEMFRAPGI